MKNASLSLRRGRRRTGLLLACGLLVGLVSLVGSVCGSSSPAAAAATAGAAASTSNSFATISSPPQHRHHYGRGDDDRDDDAGESARSRIANQRNQREAVIVDGDGGRISRLPAFSSGSSSSPLTTAYSPLSVTKIFANCAELFQFAVKELSPEERQNALANWCSKVLFGDLEEDEDGSPVLVESSGSALNKRAAKTQKFMHFGRKRKDSNAILDDESVEAPSALGNDKRAGQNRMLHFGKRTEDGGDEDDFDDTALRFNDALQQLDDFSKQAGQSRISLHFEKRTPNRFMHFGKRGTGSRFLHFGKRTLDQDYDDVSSPYFAEKRVNRFMHFGKRDDEDPDAVLHPNGPENELVKRATANNRFMHFGKRAETQRYMHFGKRSSPSDVDGSGNEIDNSWNALYFDNNVLKRSPQQNRYLHFGKKATNRFMHFGKRAGGEYQQAASNPQLNPGTNNNNRIITQQQQQQEAGQIRTRKRRSIRSETAEDVADLGFSPDELRPASQKRFTIAYPSAILQQALLRHRLDLLGKDYPGDQDEIGASEPLGHSGSGNLNRKLPQQSQGVVAFVGPEDLLDRMGRSEQFQIPQPKAQSRWTRPDRNVFLHFG